jgi:site-specific DNA-methyltransferase (adenine-specific)
MHGDCLEVLRTLPDNSVDSVVTDPPYGLSFMGKKWDYDVPAVEVWAECLRVLKPGGHLLAFAGTRTQHRMAVRIEDAGFEIRDMIAWVYGSGFPKSLDVSKAIDKAGGTLDGAYDITAPATEAAQQWQGWGTALKPAMEMITMARKPLVGTVAENVLAHGTGAINVDGCRVGCEARPVMVRTETVVSATSMNGQSTGATSSGELTTSGRWPANLIHDGSEEPCALLGDAARFFYCAKASKRDREDNNNHPTVKPTDLMRYLCRLVTPPGGVVLDPFMGSGSTGKAAMLEGFQFIGIDISDEYLEIARARINAVQPNLL